MVEVSKILQVLKKNYPAAKIVLNFGNNWELLVSVILSAQCTDKKVNEVTAKLFKKYRKLKDWPQKESSFCSWSTSTQPKSDPSGFGRASDFSLLEKSGPSENKEILNFANVAIGELEQDIKSTGFYRNKTKNIQAAAKIILEKFGGKLPKTMAEMLTIPGVARKTANVVLGNAYGVVEGIAVDTHVLRLSQRLRLVSLDEIGGGNRPIWFTRLGEPQQYASHSRGLRPRVVVSRLRGTDAPTDFSEKNQGSSVDYYKDAVPEKIEQELMKIVPKNDWFKLTYLLINHGRAICKAQKPDCGNCSLRRFCFVSRV